MLRLYDTALQEVRDLETREPGRVTLYACGPTVYDVPHIGHGRQTLTYDILRRYLEWSGYDVLHVSNITDIDDQIINRANERGRTPEDLAKEYEAAWYEAHDALGVLRPTHDPHATDYVEQMVALVAELVDRGKAYETSDGVYLDVGQVDGYGLLAQQPLESLRAGARVDVAEEKRSPLDFVLWKKSKPGEPTWDSPWGPGRPGWHTECVVMSLDLLGEGFDLHTGGLDLKFPHHENERAQAVALGREFSRRWMHHAFVEVEGEKMSKSLNNFTSLPDLLSRTDARAYRLLILQSHYRSPMEVTPDTTDQAERTLERLDGFARTSAALPDAAPDQATLDRFRERMDDDLDTPGAMRVLFDAVREVNTSADPALAAAVREMAVAVGLQLHSAADEIDPHTTSLMAQRDEARAAKDFARADAIRDELQAAGWTVEDTPGGTRVHR